MIAQPSRRWPRIVAESLASVAEPVDTIGRRPVHVAVTAVEAATAVAQAPGRAGGEAPSFLLPPQVDSWRRAQHALARWGGALLAESTGTGKTWIALAVAASEQRQTLVVAPAVLLPQWSEAAQRAGVRIHLWSQERLSRGALPRHSPSLVIIDEAHRFRDPRIRRVRTLAPWLLGRRVLLLTATPIVNRIHDLITLLRLIVTEDALALDDIAALGDLEQATLPPTALRRLIIRSAAHELSIRRRSAVITASNDEVARAALAVAAIDSLALSRDPGVKRLLQTVFLDAGASSDAALHRALARYRLLLLHSREAGGLSRAAIRRFAGDSLEQLVLWELVGSAHDSELVTADIPLITAALSAPQRDEGWIHSLLGQLGEVGPAVCFTRHRATAEVLRREIGDGAAWVTGSEAGIGPHRLPRNIILTAFGPRRAQWTARRTLPRLLIATDVAAEGLDLQAAECIAHVDLPWTAMRLAQREGRLLRLGQLHDSVRIVVRHPAPVLEARLAPRARIQRKQALSERWMQLMEQDDIEPTEVATEPQISVIDDDGVDAAMVVVALTRGHREGVRIVAREGSGTWNSSEPLVARLRARATAAIWNECAGGDAEVNHMLGDALRFVLGQCGEATPHAVALITRVQRLARAAAAQRDAVALAALDRLLRFASAPTSLGGQLLLDRLRDASDAEILRANVIECPRRHPIAARVVGALLFRSSATGLRSADARDPHRTLRS